MSEKQIKLFEAKFDQALSLDNWRVLLAYPQLLLKWQAHGTPTAVQQIARVASHRVGRHRLCGEKCSDVEGFIKQTLRTEFLNTLVTRQNQLQQQPLPLKQC